MSDETTGAIEEGVTPAPEDTDGSGQIEESAAQDQAQEPTPEELKQAIIAIQADRQREKADAEELRKQNLILQGMIERGGRQQQAPEPENLNEIATVADVMNILNKKKAEDMEYRRQERVNQSIANAKAKYKDYTEVIELADDLLKGQPDALAAIMQLNDPAEFAYLLGKSHPNYGKKGNQQVAQDVIARIQANLGQQKLPSASSTGNPPAAKKTKWTPDEVAAEFEKLTGQPL